MIDKYERPKHSAPSELRLLDTEEHESQDDQPWRSSSRTATGTLLGLRRALTKSHLVSLLLLVGLVSLATLFVTTPASSSDRRRPDQIKALEEPPRGLETLVVTERETIYATETATVAATITKLRTATVTAQPEPPIPQLNHSKLAILMETRDQPELIPVLHNFLTLVPPEWPFVVYHGDDNYESLSTSRLLIPHLETGKLRLEPLPHSRNVNGSLTRFTLTELLTGKDFWLSLPPESESLLIFQTDSILCQRSPRTVDDFLGFDEFEGGFDWVGAPWWGRGYRAGMLSEGGNGGLSLRRKSTMLSVLKKYVNHKQRAEDAWFADRIQWTTKRWPRIETALQWAYETAPDDARSLEMTWQPLGVHLGHKSSACLYHDMAVIQRLLDWCPEVRLILPFDCFPPPPQVEDDKPPAPVQDS